MAASEHSLVDRDDHEDARIAAEAQAVRGTADEPVWRRDFPFTTAGEEAVTRREFARYLVLASGAFAAGTLGIAAWAQARSAAKEAVPTAILPAADLAVGQSHLFRWPGPEDPAILVAVEDGLVAFSQKCTHLGCVVYPARVPLPRGLLRHPHRPGPAWPAGASARAHRRRNPRRRHGLGPRTRRRIGGLMAPGRPDSSGALIVYVIVLLSLQVLPVGGGAGRPVGG